jgi:hypothetical protein
MLLRHITSAWAIKPPKHKSHQRSSNSPLRTRFTGRSDPEVTENDDDYCDQDEYFHDEARPIGLQLQEPGRDQVGAPLTNQRSIELAHLCGYR